MKLIAIIALALIAGCTTVPIGGTVGKTQDQIDLQNEQITPFMWIQMYFYKWTL
jgi:hypothetical protein